MIAAGVNGVAEAPVIILAVGSAAALAAVDIVYVGLGTIAKVYLLDAALEIVLLIAWAAALFAG